MDDSHALSNLNIIDFLGNFDIPIKFVPYHELPNIEHIDDILPCILLYELGRTMGHWVALFRDNNGIINYFDSLGKLPDNWLGNFDNYARDKKKWGADYTHLIDLMVRDLDQFGVAKNNNIIWNQYQLQAFDTFTCGYWCACRLLFNQININNEGFHDLFKKFKNKDDKIVKLYNLLKSL